MQKAAGTLPFGSVSFRRKQQTSALGKLETKREGKRWLEQMSSFVTIPQPAGKEEVNIRMGKVQYSNTIARFIASSLENRYYKRLFCNE